MQRAPMCRCHECRPWVLGCRDRKTRTRRTQLGCRWRRARCVRPRPRTPAAGHARSSGPDPLPLPPMPPPSPSPSPPLQLTRRCFVRAGFRRQAEPDAGAFYPLPGRYLPHNARHCPGGAPAAAYLLPYVSGSSAASGAVIRLHRVTAAAAGSTAAEGGAVARVGLNPPPFSVAVPHGEQVGQGCLSAATARARHTAGDLADPNAVVFTPGRPPPAVTSMRSCGWSTRCSSLQVIPSQPRPTGWCAASIQSHAIKVSTAPH